MSRFRWIAALAVTACCALPAPALANHSVTSLVSIGPDGGNGASAGVFRGSSVDGSRVFFQTAESLVAADTDSSIDLYERSGGTTTLLTTGPNGGNGTPSATYAGASQDGTHVFFRTTEKLVSSDTDNVVDIYERFNGATTLVSTGPNGGNGNINVIFDKVTPDGGTVFFDTSESLVSGDTDSSRDVYQRTGGTTTWVSAGAIGGNAPLNAMFSGASADGSHVYFTTDEPLAPTDVDTMMDIYQRFAGTTLQLSIGPAGGNGNIDFDYDAFFAGNSADGTKAWITTDEVLTFDDTDTQTDVYEVTGGGVISLISTGSAGGNGDFGAFFDGATADGSKVFLDTQEQLEATDGDSSYDVYQHSDVTTTQVSTGPNGGNGAFFSVFNGVNADGSKVFFSTADPLVASDTDASVDLYQRSGGQTALVSTGLGTSGENPATYSGASADGSRVFFLTEDPLQANDTDVDPDLYERTNGGTTLLSIGPNGGNGDFLVAYDGASQDGTKVFYDTPEQLVSTDTDGAQDVYSAAVLAAQYPRPKGATPERLPLVPAYQECTSPTETHALPLSSPSCAPSQVSSNLTIGSPDANGATANSVGFVRFDVIPGNGGTMADEADVRITVSMSDVRNKSDFTDYTGELRVVPTIRITDRLSGASPVDQATVEDLEFPATVPCAATGSLSIGSLCSITTSADAILPNTVIEIKKTIWATVQVKVYDGGADGDADTVGDNTLFATPGVFVP